MIQLPEPIDAYVRAYNSKDVDGMLDCLAENVTFRNYSGDELTAAAADKAMFEAVARSGAEAFEMRTQRVRHAVTVADITIVEIDYAALVASDLPNGWKAGQRVAFSCASLFRLDGDKILEIVDQS